MNEPLTASIIIVFVGGIIAQILASVSAKRRMIIETDLSREDALRAVDKALRLMWRRVDGPGALNRRLVFPLPLPWERPTLSADVSEPEDGTVTVSVWMSSWSQVLGTANFGLFAVLRKRKVASQLSRASDHRTTAAGGAQGR